MATFAGESDETIAAIATPTGRGGVGIVRVSGPATSIIAEQILRRPPKPRYAMFADFYDEQGGVIDQGIALYFKAPNSFTGEDVLELQGHGGMVLLDRLLKRTFALGARLAKPGEFSERAFLNGKIDLIQAEAIADLIDAATEKATQCAMRSLQGEFSSRINALAEAIEDLRSEFEAAIDFPEEDFDTIGDNEKLFGIQNILNKIDEVINMASQGTLLCEGISVVIIGKPNAGKSSLLNQLSCQDVAIVTDIPGTTRDVLRSRVQIDGIPINLIDTAGLRESKNVIEQEGIRRAWQEVNNADLILLILDASENKERNPRRIIEKVFPKLLGNKKVILVFNKTDLTCEDANVLQDKQLNSVFVSAKTGAGIPLLKECIKTVVGFASETEGVFSARRRHLEALENSKGKLEVAMELLKEQQIDLSAENLRLAHVYLQEITGKFSSEDLLYKIFSNFCIGK